MGRIAHFIAIAASIVSLGAVLAPSQAVAAPAVCSLSACARVRAIPSAQSYFETLSSRFDADAARRTEGVIQWTLTGEGGGSWYAVVDSGTVTVQSGSVAHADLTLTMNATDYVAMVNEELNGKWLFVSGKAKADGSIPLAMKLESIFPL